MNLLFRRFFALFLCLCLLCSCFLPSQAEETEPTAPPELLAEDISSCSLVTDADGINLNPLFDGKTYYGYASADQAHVTLYHEGGIGSLYLIFWLPYGPYTMTNNDTGAVHTCGTHGFLYEFQDLVEIFGTAPSSVTLTFDNGPVTINELTVYTPGRVPDTVQKWEAPAEDGTDLILFSTHGDDEQLFFAGLLPYYAAELDYEVLVVYMTDHQNQSTTRRMREMLAGLWAVGVRTYPVFGYFGDVKKATMEQTYQWFESQGHTREELLGFVVEQLRRFNPKVVVGHDFNGEYRHAQHMVYTDLLVKALEISNDPAAYPELAEKYGLWDVPKTYIHLYEENPIIMDWDQPLESFDGLTAFQVTQKYGFPAHKSQQRSWFHRWLYGYRGEIRQASQITEYSPCEYGLYRSTVGADVEKNDFFENVTTHAQDRQAEEERLAEEARLKAEAEAKAKAEDEARKKAEEEAARKKAEAEAQARAEAEAEAKRQQEQAQQARQRKIRHLSAGAALILGLVFYGIYPRKNSRKFFEKYQKKT